MSKLPDDQTSENSAHKKFNISEVQELASKLLTEDELRAIIDGYSEALEEGIQILNELKQLCSSYNTTTDTPNEDL